MRSVLDAGVWGEKLGVSVWNFGKKRETLRFFFPNFFFGEMNSLRVQFQSFQLNLCEQKSRNLVGHLLQTRHVIENAGFFDMCFARLFYASTHETGERSLWMLEPTELRRVIGKVKRWTSQQNKLVCLGQFLLGCWNVCRFLIRDFDTWEYEPRISWHGITDKKSEHLNSLGWV